MTRIEFARGVVMPFYPMRPFAGRTLRTAKLVGELYEEVREPDDWVCQPKLGGDRVCVGVIDKRVYIQNRHGSWYKFRVRNQDILAKLPSYTVLDGEVYAGVFYAFDALVVHGHSYMRATAAEREVMAIKTMELVGQPWIFDRPSRQWLLKRREHLPKFEGVVLKEANSPYTILASPTQISTTWMKRMWA